MNKKLLLLMFLVCVVFQNVYSQGCLINNYDAFNKVFTKPTATGARTFVPGDGNNFVRWEGACGPHTYVRTDSDPNGTCSVTDGSVTKNGIYYSLVSSPFPQTCNAPLDDNMIWAMLLLMPATYLYIKKRELKLNE